uniref:6-hydroxymethylpterin diphosphokinase MptE-like domain-containing protein n=1 Tax=viral metagenome TaxID=1070528 RepID=A0A6M3XYC1_9ZZZZ
MLKETDIPLSSQQYNVVTDATLQPLEIKNAFHNFQQIKSEFDSGIAIDAYTQKLKYTDPKRAPKDDYPTPTETTVPCIIVGSGITLDKAGPLLKDWDYPIITSSSHATTLAYYGHDPEMIFVLDPKTRKAELEPVPPLYWERSDSNIVVHPGLYPELINAWPAEWGKMYFREVNPAKEFYYKTLAIAYDFITTFMFLFSSATSGQVGLAHMLGYNPLFLVGCEFGAPGLKDRFTRYFYEGGDWRAEQPPDPPKSQLVESIYGVPTYPILIHYRRALAAVWRCDMPQLIQTSNIGNFRECPYVPIEEIVECQGMGLESVYWTKDHIKEISDRLMAHGKMFAVPLARRPDGKEALRFLELDSGPDCIQKMERYLDALEQLVQKNPPEDAELIFDKAKSMDYIKRLYKEVGGAL